MKILYVFIVIALIGIICGVAIGISNKNRGTAFVVYEDLIDAKKAVEKLKGINVLGKYLVCLYFNPRKEKKKEKENDDDEK